MAEQSPQDVVIKAQSVDDYSSIDVSATQSTGSAARAADDQAFAVSNLKNAFENAIPTESDQYISKIISTKATISDSETSDLTEKTASSLKNLTSHLLIFTGRRECSGCFPASTGTSRKA